MTAVCFDFEAEEVLIELVLLGERHIPSRTSPVCQRCSFEASRAVDRGEAQTHSRVAGFARAGTGRTAERRGEAVAVEARCTAVQRACVAGLAACEALETLGVGVPVVAVYAGETARLGLADAAVLDFACCTAAIRQIIPFLADLTGRTETPFAAIHSVCASAKPESGRQAQHHEEHHLSDGDTAAVV